MEYVIKGWNLFIYTFKNSFNFNGRAGRMEVISWIVMLWIIEMILFAPLFVILFLAIMFLATSQSEQLPIIFFIIWGLLALINVVVLPGSISLAVRRMHDLNMSGWWVLLFNVINFIPLINLIGTIFVLYLYLLKKGDEGANKYGLPFDYPQINEIPSSQIIKTSLTAYIIIIFSIIGLIIYSIKLNQPKINNAEYTTSAQDLKKADTIISNAFKTMMKEDKVNDLGQTKFFTNMTSQSSSSDEFQKYLDVNLRKYFKIKSTCLAFSDNCKYVKYQYLNFDDNFNKAFDQNETFSAYTEDNNMIVYFDLFKNGYEKYRPDKEIKYYGGKMLSLYGFIYVDTNGEALPNRWGLDLFGFNLAQDGNLYPFYGKDRAIYGWGENWETQDFYWRNDSNLCGIAGQKINFRVYGNGCASRIIENKWVKDY